MKNAWSTWYCTRAHLPKGRWKEDGIQGHGGVQGRSFSWARSRTPRMGFVDNNVVAIVFVIACVSILMSLDCCNSSNDVVTIIWVEDYVLHDEKLNPNKGASTAGTRWLIDDEVCWCTVWWCGLHCITRTLKYHSWKHSEKELVTLSYWFTRVLFDTDASVSNCSRAVINGHCGHWALTGSMHFCCFLDRNGPIGPLGTNCFRCGYALSVLFVHSTYYLLMVSTLICLSGSGRRMSVCILL